jgi:hypothetical protein
MMFLITFMYCLIGLLVATTKIYTQEGSEIFDSMSEKEKNIYFMNVTFFWPKYIFENE